MSLSESFVPESWLNAAKITEITTENVATFGSQNLNWLLLKEKDRQTNSKSVSKKNEHAENIMFLSRAFCLSENMPIFPNIRENWHFKNGDKILILKNNFLYEANISGESHTADNTSFLPKEGAFSVIDRTIKVTSPLIIKRDEFERLKENPRYFQIWAKVGGMYHESVTAYSIAMVKHSLLETVK